MNDGQPSSHSDNRGVGHLNCRFEILALSQNICEIRSLVLVYVLICGESQCICYGCLELFGGLGDVHGQIPSWAEHIPPPPVDRDELAFILPNADPYDVKSVTDPALFTVYELHGTILPRDPKASPSVVQRSYSKIETLFAGLCGGSLGEVG